MIATYDAAKKYWRGQDDASLEGARHGYRRGWSRQRLAKEVGIGRATAYRLLPMEPIENEIWSSTAVPEICAVLGLPPPMEATEIARDEQDRKILELVRSLPSETKQDLIRMIERLLPPSKG